MILYNITFNIDKDSENEWLEYMRDEYVPVYLKTGYFKSNKMLKLLNEEYIEQGSTYTLQLMTENLDELEDFRFNYEESIEGKLIEKFRGKFVFFKTWLEELS